MGKIWLIPLILIWVIGGYFIIDYFWEQPEKTDLYIQGRGYYPIGYTANLRCEDLDSYIITEGDEISCEYNFVADKIISLLP